MSEPNCRGCQYHGDCAGRLAGAMGWGNPWGVQNGVKEKPHCPTWRKRHEEDTVRAAQEAKR